MLRALATSSCKRSLTLPEVTTSAEAGVPGYETANWWGVVAPRATPPAIVSRLNEEIKAVLAMPDVEKRLVNEGAGPAIKTPAELGQYAAEIEKWVKVARIAGVRGECADETACQGCRHDRREPSYLAALLCCCCCTCSVARASWRSFSFEASKYHATSINATSTAIAPYS
jgi:hypothetical protein